MIVIRSGFMKNSTFCVMLAAVLMLMGGICARFMQNQPDDVTAYEETMMISEANRQDSAMIEQAAGEIVYEYGAQFEKEYRCWSMRDHMKMNAENTVLKAAAECVAEEIERTEGGSRLTLRAGNRRLIIWPVTGVLIFEGSRIQPGDEIGRVEEFVSFKAVDDEKTVDPTGMIRKSQ